MDNLGQKLEYLRWLKSIGIEYYFSEQKDSDISPNKQAKPNMIKASAAKKVKANEIPKTVEESGLPTTQARKLADTANSLEQLKEMVENFNGCDLKKFAMNTVFADGNKDAKIMLVGEAPGAKEDERGIPFCGESGMLLDTMLKVIGLSRQENIYITNTIFWRPPGNRRPTQEEMDTCRPFLEKHIALINPKLIICVGSTAVTGLLGDKITISLGRNNKYSYKNQYLSKPIDTMSIFHPAYLLRQSEKKKDTWFDLIKIQEFIQNSGF